MPRLTSLPAWCVWCVLLLPAWRSWAVESAMPTIDAVVDLATAWSIGGVSALQPINGLCVNGMSRMEHVQETRALRPRTVRLYLWCENLLPGWERLTREERQRALLTVDADAAVPAFFDRMLGIDPTTGRRTAARNPQFSQLEQLQAWDARGDIVLQIGQPHPRGPEDFPACARWFVACVREVRRRYPDLAPLQVMLFNEPDYEYPRPWDERGLAESVELYADLFRHVAVELGRECPGVRLLGPGISQFMRWDAWRNWTIPFLTRAPAADRFNCQPYSWRFDDLLAWTEALQAASLRINGHGIPLAATESNVDLGQPAGEWWLHRHHAERVQREADALVGMLSRPDLFAMKHYFYYHYTCNYHDLWFTVGDRTEPAPVYWLHWLLRDVRGTRLLAATSPEDRRLAVLAAAEDGTVTLLLHNRGRSPLAVAPEMRWPPRTAAPCGVKEWLRFDDAARRFVHGEEPLPQPPARLLLAPGELVKMRWVAPPPARFATATAEERICRSSAAGEACRDRPLAVDIQARPPAADEIARLRLAVFVCDVLGVDRIRWSLNGRAMESAFRAEERAQPILHIDAAVPAEWVGAANRLELQAVDGVELRLMHATLALVPLPAGMAYRRADLLVPAPAPLHLALELPAQVEPGPIPVALRAVNATAQEVAAVPVLALPEGWLLEAPLAPMRIPAGGCAEARATVLVPPGLRGDRFIRAALTAPGLPEATCRRGTIQHVPFTARTGGEPPRIDGSLAEWTGDRFIAIDHAAPGIPPHRSRIAARWDDACLYLAVEVSGRPLRPVPAGGSPWHHDTLELFLDYGAERRTSRDHRCMQAFIVLRDGALGAPRWGNCPNDPNGVFLQHTAPPDYRVAVVETADGFRVEAALPWRSLTDSGFLPAGERFVPRAGGRIGFDAALANRPILGDTEKRWTDPSRWGGLLLLGPEQATAPATAPVLRLDQHPPEPLRLRFASDATAGWRFPPADLREDGVHLAANHTALIGGSTVAALAASPCTVGAELALAAPAGGGAGSQLRLFLAPDPLPAFVEPYTMPDTVCLVVERRAAELVLLLACKDGSPQGWGRVVWRGTAPATEWPLRAALRLDAATYRLAMPAHVQTTGGSLSGAHGLSSAAWAAPLRIGVKAVHAPAAGTGIIRELTVR